jgi:hypothetical protein
VASRGGQLRVLESHHSGNEERLDSLLRLLLLDERPADELQDELPYCDS